ncbi:Cyclin-D2-1 [Zostera marina]|uniref:Cyclin-D2-1 n=1 Tax=Zostera marina TaxID=29655 RepID=A0A0K9PT26_ZOSMR|nr:Cyclin-D2-1 [Zostera marina]
MEGETEYLSTRFDSSREPIPSWSRSVDWIIKVSKCYNFSALSTYLAVSYMDRFLSSHEFPEPSGWPMQLLSVACLSLSAKLEEPEVPSLLDLQIEDASFVFEPRTVCRMELLILKSLNWRLSIVTPFAFLDFFFISKIGKPNRHFQLYSCVKAVIINSIRDAKLFEHSPSVIAAAAIVHAAAKDETMINLDTVISWWSSGEVLHKEEIINCYNLIDGQRKRILHHPSPTSSSSSSSKSKRRKLNYSNLTPE